MTARTNGHIASSIGAGAARHRAATREVDGTYPWVLVEQLTQREQTVLELLPSGLSYKELANELDVSLNTVKSHLKSTYRKLAAGSRREAIERADRLGLLPGSGSSDRPSGSVMAESARVAPTAHRPPSDQPHACPLADRRVRVAARTSRRSATY